jgi:hypothetical protein
MRLLSWMQSTFDYCRRVSVNCLLPLGRLMVIAIRRRDQIDLELDHCLLLLSIRDISRGIVVNGQC